MALGTISVLLIIVTWVANIFINEMKLSRTLYDDTVANLSAEWVFEYAMLKVRNHREGFSDSLVASDPDGEMFRLETERSKSLITGYRLETTSHDKTFTLPQNEHLILPLFSSSEWLIAGSNTSKKPEYNQGVAKVKEFSITGNAGMNWTIIAQSGSESIGLNGIGEIQTTSLGTLRQRARDCYDINGNKLLNCSGDYAEALDYFYDTDMWVADFLARTNITDPYLMIYNPSSSQDIRIKSHVDTPFALPQITLEATAQKNDSLQVYRFQEDKSRYFETLKYGIYNNE